MRTPSFSGTGPGARSADGCSVELYRRLPYVGELDWLLPRLPQGARVLELGCGTGRLTQRLLDSGARVTAVDSSASMLMHLPHAAERVCSDIAGLRLGRRFDVVLLPSCLINHPVEPTRRAYLDAAAEHLAPGALFAFERHDPEWLRGAAVGELSSVPPFELAVDTVVHEGDVAHMSLGYTAGDQRWTHRFSARVLDDAAIAAALAAAGFTAPRWIDRRWAEATRLA
jgi:SAM-dependent methyltransferase